MSEVRTMPRRLVDLNPHWQMTTDGLVYGIAYDCPCGLPQYEHGGPVAWADCCTLLGTQQVPTKTNFHPGGIASSADSQVRGWDLTGDSFETITLSPSIHHVGHWHGFIRNGQLESC